MMNPAALNPDARAYLRDLIIARLDWLMSLGTYTRHDPETHATCAGGIAELLALAGFLDIALPGNLEAIARDIAKVRKGMGYP